MTVRFFSDKTRPIHMGPYPSELLMRGEQPIFRGVPKQTQLTFTSDKPHSVINAMREHQAMLDAIRDGLLNRGQSDIPSDVQERADHLKAFGFFNDAAAVGICGITDTDCLEAPFRNPNIDRLAHDLQARQTKSLASGIDMIMADLKDLGPSACDLN